MPFDRAGLLRANHVVGTLYEVRPTGQEGTQFLSGRSRRGLRQKESDQGRSRPALSMDGRNQGENARGEKFAHGDNGIQGFSRDGEQT